jgi:hypothetical protein
MLSYFLLATLTVSVLSAPATQQANSQLNFNGFQTFAPFPTFAPFAPFATFAPFPTFAPWPINNQISSQQQSSTINGVNLFQSSVFNGTHLIFTNNTNTYIVPVASVPRALDLSILTNVQQTLQSSVVQAQINQFLASLGSNPVLQSQLTALINGFVQSPNPQQFLIQNYMNAFLIYNSLPASAQQTLLNYFVQLNPKP